MGDRRRPASHIRARSPSRGRSAGDPVVDNDGLAGLSMRSLAAALGTDTNDALQLRQGPGTRGLVAEAVLATSACHAVQGLALRLKPSPPPSAGRRATPERRAVSPDASHGVRRRDAAERLIEALGRAGLDDLDLLAAFAARPASYGRCASRIGRPVAVPQPRTVQCVGSTTHRRPRRHRSIRTWQRLRRRSRRSTMAADFDEHSTCCRPESRTRRLNRRRASVRRDASALVDSHCHKVIPCHSSRRHVDAVLEVIDQ